MTEGSIYCHGTTRVGLKQQFFKVRRNGPNGNYSPLRLCDPPGHDAKACSYRMECTKGPKRS
jgi:hypothetical protein